MCKCCNPCADLNCGNDMPDSRSPTNAALESQPELSQPKFLELSYAGTVDRYYGQGKREIYYLKSEVDEYLAKLSQPIPGKCACGKTFLSERCVEIYVNSEMHRRDKCFVKKVPKTQPASVCTEDQDCEIHAGDCSLKQAQTEAKTTRYLLIEIDTLIKKFERLAVRVGTTEQKIQALEDSLRVTDAFVRRFEEWKNSFKFPQIKP